MGGSSLRPVPTSDVGDIPDEVDFVAEVIHGVLGSPDGSVWEPLMLAGGGDEMVVVPLAA
jgi:hypothetical protein